MGARAGPRRSRRLGRAQLRWSAPSSASGAWRASRRSANCRRSPASSTERTSLYAGPGIFYPIVGELPEGSDVKVFTRDHDFYAIDQ